MFSGRLVKRSQFRRTVRRELPRIAESLGVKEADEAREKLEITANSVSPLLLPGESIEFDPDFVPDD